MKPSILKSFIREWLEIHDIEPEIHGSDRWSFPVPRGMRERLGCKELTLAFTQRAVARHPRSELATVGNPVFDRLLGIAREEGRIGVGYRKAKGTVRPPALRSVPSIDGIEPRKGERTYQAIYHMVFSVSYPSLEAADEMEVVSIDGGNLEVQAQTPDLTQLWGQLEPAPKKGRTILPALPLPAPVLDAGLQALERRMRRRINKVRQTSAKELERETASIENYYRQLIEEARNQSRRWSTRTEDREDRVRWLQLEWKRRVEEATAFWRPQVNARFVALGIEMVPRVAYRYPIARSKGRATPKGPIRVWDEAARTMLLPYCAACGQAGLEEPRIVKPGCFYCSDCAKKTNTPPARKGEMTAQEIQERAEALLDAAARGSVTSSGRRS